nr:uncharacterized protein LOC123567477 isoform X1 [Macaca fascicularis]
MLSKILLVVYTAFQTTYLQEKSWITLNISFKNLKNVLTLNNLNKCDFVSFLIDIVSVDSRTISLSHPSPCDKMTGISRDKRQAAAHSKVSFHPSDRAPKLRIVAITHKQQHGKEASAAEVIWIQEEREDTFNQKPCREIFLMAFATCPEIICHVLVAPERWRPSPGDHVCRKLLDATQLVRFRGHILRNGRMISVWAGSRRAPVRCSLDHQH